MPGSINTGDSEGQVTLGLQILLFAQQEPGKGFPDVSKSKEREIVVRHNFTLPILYYYTGGQGIARW